MKKVLCVFIIIILIMLHCSYTTNTPIQLEELNYDQTIDFEEDNAVIFTGIIIKSEPITEEPIPNPCFREPQNRWDIDIRYVHTWLDDNWTCSRCGEYVGPRYGFTECDIFLLAQLIAGDKDRIGDGEFDFTYSIQNGHDLNYYQIGLVLSVVMNRVRDDRFPNTVREVVLENGQFCPMPRNLNTNPCPLVIEKIGAWCEAYDNWSSSVQVVPTDHMWFAGNGFINRSRSVYR